ncbi:MAG: ATP synthase F0 subunit C [bacterium]|nr:ATP synthase F0 subunit C [bacterium]
MDLETAKVFAAGLTIALGVIFPALAIGLIGREAMRGISRNPDASDKIQLTALLLVAFAEALGIYTLVVALIIKFV